MINRSPWIRQCEEGVVLEIRAVPGAKRCKIGGLHDERLKITVNRPASEGAANQALLEFLSEVLGLTRSKITIISGETHREKRVLIEGITFDAAHKLLESKL